jgi:signal transduction histidine kinase
VFPNPFREEVHIVLPVGFAGGMLVLYDVQGRRTVETEIPESHGQQSFAVQTPDLKPGVYLVKLAGKGGGVWRRKAVKK